MVEEVRAFKDASGKLHISKLEALESEAIVKLANLGVFNHASACAIVANANDVHDILDFIIEGQR